MPDLAAVVPKPEAGMAIDALRAEGVYDDARSVVDAGDGTLELPVTDPPAETAVIDVVEQVEPVSRLRGLDDRLREAGWSDDELASAPKSWGVVGDAVLVRFPDDCPDRAAVAEALLDLHGADSVFDRGDVSGPTREPDVTAIAGSGDPEVVHVEHGTRYALDLTEVMFSSGNQAERVRMGEVTAADERVLDAFAGIGYFALPMARAGADVAAIEVNPAAFRYLVENAVLNGVEARCSATLGDCREVVGAGPAPAGAFDRLVLGHFDAPAFLGDLLPVLASGGIVHLHAAVSAGDGADGPVAALRSAATGLDRDLEVLDRRPVKSYAPGIDHVVVDARVD